VYYDDFNIEDYDENWDFNKVVNGILNKEVDERTSAVKKALDTYKKNYKQAIENIESQKATIKELQNKVSNSTVYTDFINALDKENVANFIRLIYTPDFKEENSFDYAPVWFQLVINYYRNKDKVIEILKSAGIDVPDSAKHLRLPFDWDAEEITSFISHTYNGYITNGCIFGGNIGFWYQTKLWNDPMRNCSSQYMYVPWQFVLRNPILNSKKFCKQMAAEINKGDCGLYYTKIAEYQKLDKENLDAMVGEINIKKLKKPEQYTIDLLFDGIDAITDTEQLDALYTLVRGKYKAIDYILKMPKSYLKKFLHDENVDAKRIILELNDITQEEKIELLKDFI